jgi:hypothetical protein
MAALGYFVFPGHAWLQQDTQIYVPMLERLWDPSLFARELITSRPHLAWTAYDEIALLLRRVTGFGFETVLMLEMFLFRIAGIWGVYLMGRSLRFSMRQSLLIAGVFSLGATIVGPAVLTFEYEPVPRGFAVMLTFLAIGLAMLGRLEWAGVAAAAAFLYHAPTVLPFFLVFALASLAKRKWKPFAPVAAAAALIVVLSRLQPGITEKQPFFSRISPTLEHLQRLRAPYNWVSAWNSDYFWHYGLLFLFVVAAVLRLRRRLDAPKAIILAGLPVLGMLSVPFAAITLERMKWSLIPQLQPARAVLFITAMAVILGVAAAIAAAERLNYIEAFAWMLIPFAVPSMALLMPPYNTPAVITTAALALTAVAFLTIDRLRPVLAWPALGLVVAGAMFAIPGFAHVRNYPTLETAALSRLAGWAKANTTKDSVFLFAGFGKSHEPGLFRAEAERAVYVDWKGGGQANYFEDLAREWWRRWQETMTRPITPSRAAALGIDYLVYRAPQAAAELSPAYSNDQYVVVRTSTRSAGATH